MADITFGVFFEKSERNRMLDDSFNDSRRDVPSDRSRNLFVRGESVQWYKVLDAIVLDDLQRSGGAVLDQSQLKGSLW